MILRYYINEKEYKSLYTKILRLVQPLIWESCIYPAGIDAMKKAVYEPPKLEKVGNMKDLIRGSLGDLQDAGGADSYNPEP